MMTSNAYCKQWGVHETAVTNWAKENHGDPVIAAMVLERYAAEERKFKSLYHMNQALLREVHDIQRKPLDEILSKNRTYNIKKMNFWNRVKWLLRG